MEKRTFIKTDRNGTSYYMNHVCPRCNGTGSLPYWYANGVCFKCGGSGRFDTVEKVYTEEYKAKLQAARERKAELKRQEALDEFDAHRQEGWMKLGFNADAIAYCVCGDTYAIREQLKAAGAKFCRELGWHFDHKVSDYETVEVFAEEVLSEDLVWEYGKPHFAFRKDAADIVKAKMPKKEIVPSEYVGEVGQKIEKTLVLKRVYSFDSQFGVTHICNFADEAGNVFIWKTGSWRGDEGKTYTIKGMLKDHSEYKGIKQNVLTRCKVA